MSSSLILHNRQPFPHGLGQATKSQFSFLFFSSFYFFFISWRLITLQYCSGFCHTLKWISHGFTCVSHPENSFESVLMRWMKLEPIIQSEVSQKAKDHYSILTHIYGVQKVNFIQLVMTSSLVGLSRNTKALPKAKFAPPKRVWSLFSGLLLIWCTIALWIPKKNPYIWEACSANW